MDKREKKDALKRLSLRNPMHFLAVGFGSGLSPFMPGTVGSIAAIPLVLSFIWLPVWLQVITALLACIVGIKICGVTAKDLKVHDHSAIVWDEVAGMLITFIAVPITLTNVVLGFLLFRILDILKPWPINQFDKRIHGGLGIMLDDIVAGVLAAVALHINMQYGLI